MSIIGGETKHKLLSTITGLRSRLFTKHFLVFLASIVVATGFVSYTVYRLGEIVFKGFNENIAPLDSLPKETLITLPYLGELTYVSLVALSLKVAVLILGISAIYNTVLGKGIEKTITSIYMIIIIAVGTGNFHLRDAYLVIWTTMIVLYLYPLIRGWRLTLTGRFREAYSNVYGSLVVNAVVTPIFYVAPIGIALWVGGLISDIVKQLESLRLTVPPPLPDIWSLFTETRIAVIAFSILILLVMSWVIREVSEGILLSLLITPKEALDRISAEIYKETRMVVAEKTWHQTIPVDLYTTLASIIIYGLVSIIVKSITLRYAGFLGSIPWYILLLLNISITFLVWGIIRREFRKFFSHKSIGGFSYKSILLLALLLALILWNWLYYTGTLDPIYMALGMTPPSPAGDIISNSGFDPSQLARGIADMFYNLEGKARMVVAFLWG